jgi:hypothetical protein
MKNQEKQDLEHEINRARDGVSNRIDELDTRLRRRLDFATMASEHAPQLIAGGAVVGFLVGFGFPKQFKRVIQLGVPLAVAAYKVKRMRAGRNGNGADSL